MEESNKNRIHSSSKNMVFETSEEVKVHPTFDSMNLKENLLRGIYFYGFDKPSAVQ